MSIFPASFLLAAGVLFPLALAAACTASSVRRRALGLLWFAPLPALAAALVVPNGVLALAPAPFRVTLRLDPAGAVLLGASALLWALAGAYARFYMAKDEDRAGFAVWWLLTLAGSLGVFLVGDIASFYLAFALVSLAAFGLAAHLDTAAAQRAGLVYLALTLFGEAVLLLAFVMLAQAGEAANPLIRETVALLPGLAHGGLIAALLILGFGLKMGLVPLHVWMPLAHSVAPVPGSAVLSGIVVKAGVIGLIRFLPFGTVMTGAGGALLVLGLFTAFYGIAIALTQMRPKTVLAYSTVSQMGLVAAVLGGALLVGEANGPVLAAFYAANHVLLKGAMFLTVGIAGASGRGALRPVLIVAALLGLSLAGLPLTGGALAKYAVKDPLGDGLAGLLATLSAAGTTLVMLRFVNLLPDESKAGDALAPRALLIPWGLLVIAALIAPFALFSLVTGANLSAAFSGAALWSALWPVGLGVALAAGLDRLTLRPPEVPPGDVLVLVERAGGAFATLPILAARLDGVLARWPVAALALTALVLALAALQL